MYKPASTYRVQFHKGFNFKAFRRIIPYLKNLGVDTIYASPIFAAIPASTHGYDITDPWKINPEIGTEQELLEISKILTKAGIGWLQDIVPNHMAFHPDNLWLMDVLKRGAKSDFFPFFDIDPDGGKLMVPFLEEKLAEAVEQGKIKLVQKVGVYFLSYQEESWPVNALSTKLIGGKSISEINKNKVLLQSVIEKQFYQLCNWQETNEKINYRRFFTVNGLICLNIHDKKVFDIYHQYIFELVRKGIFQGLRIDHIDGLYDPKQYLDRLKAELGSQPYIVVEKILGADEKLPQDWACAGTTGYDFLAKINNLFTNKAAKQQFDKLYGAVIGKELNPALLIIEKKRSILNELMRGELENLFNYFISLNLVEDLAFNSTTLKKAIGEMLIAMPVYRYYNYDFPLVENEQTKIIALVKPIIKNHELKECGELLRKVFLDLPLKGNKDYNNRVKLFYQRCMQFTGPLMAKGVEDTLMFTFNRFTGHNEVGDAPEAFGLSLKKFHKEMISRLTCQAYSMNASATHDTKKGEDIRARLNVLTEIPREWAKEMKYFLKLTAKLSSKENNFKDIHLNDQYLIMQNLIGIIPFQGEQGDSLEERLGMFLQKALREGKKRSDWAAPNEEYETLVKRFVEVLLNGAFRAAIDTFVNKITEAAILNSLAQVVLKFGCPGIPDVYQGTELWDLSLVDPDNRRKVDYVLRNEFLKTIQEPADLGKLWESRRDGKIKLYLTSKLLKLRKTHRAVFENGNYLPLRIRGKYAKHIFAFARNFENEWLLFAIPIAVQELMNSEVKIDWGDTEILLPDNAPSGVVDLLSGKKIYRDVLSKGVLVDQVFKTLNLGVLQLMPNPSGRAAGILMHISSLPSAFGIGDMGKEAFKFVNFLAKSKQQYWQILPLNPTKEENGNSPYSSNSTMAGNSLLISLDALYQLGLLTERELEGSRVPSSSVIDFQRVSSQKKAILKLAYQRFNKVGSTPLKKEYATFLIEQSWLPIFSLYTVIKQHHQGTEWYNWLKEFKFRDQSALMDFEIDHHQEIDEIKWQQFIFYHQWKALKTFANKKQIKIIGDLPFYLDYDSVDVWSRPEYFKLKSDLSLDKVAGVPPDYFNKKGQLWGMPIFNWEKMKADGFSWWIDRLAWNVNCFDLVRLDHFLAFSAYWEIDAASQDATKGVWKDGVGAVFFQAVKNALGGLPFIAEDLGERSEKSEQLKLQFELPGMAVMQFGFGEDLTGSTHIPFNIDEHSVIYTGTHDNNTVKGWFTSDLKADERKRLFEFSGKKLSEKNINRWMCKTSYAANGKLVILPIQDVLRLDASSRMNIPGEAMGNWSWRLSKDALTSSLAKQLAKQVRIYGRLL